MSALELYGDRLPASYSHFGDELSLNKMWYGVGHTISLQCGDGKRLFCKDTSIQCQADGSWRCSCDDCLTCYGKLIHEYDHLPKNVSFVPNCLLHCLGHHFRLKICQMTRVNNYLLSLNLTSCNFFHVDQDNPKIIRPNCILYSLIRVSKLI